MCRFLTSTDMTVGLSHDDTEASKIHISKIYHPDK